MMRIIGRLGLHLVLVIVVFVIPSLWIVYEPV